VRAVKKNNVTTRRNIFANKRTVLDNRPFKKAFNSIFFNGIKSGFFANSKAKKNKFFFWTIKAGA